MDKKNRPKRAGSNHVSDASSSKVKDNSGPAGKGSQGLNFRLNEQGEYCIGDDCFQMRIKPGAGEVRVVVDRNECGIDGQQVVDALFGEVVKGAPTVYETVSKRVK